MVAQVWQNTTDSYRKNVFFSCLKYKQKVNFLYISFWPSLLAVLILNWSTGAAGFLYPHSPLAIFFFLPVCFSPFNTHLIMLKKFLSAITPPQTFKQPMRSPEFSIRKYIFFKLIDGVHNDKHFCLLGWDVPDMWLVKSVSYWLC